jgi:hypothetical protein
MFRSSTAALVGEPFLAVVSDHSMAPAAARPLFVRRSIVRIASLLALFAALFAFPREASAEPGDEITISVLTFGPGDHPFFKFGHNAIWVHDESKVGIWRDIIYNYGTFGFDSPWLLLDFFKGKLRYWLSRQSLYDTVRAYKSENRTIDSQELELTPAQRKQVADFLVWNAQPDNKYYKYDYYQDNCSTRVRDVIDKAAGGRVHDVSNAPAEFSWRQHTLRLVADDLPVYLGLNVAMGDFIDKPVHQWEEMFLPSKLQESLRRAKVPGPNGSEIPLVKAEKHILEAPGRAPLRTAPPAWKLPLFLVGALLGGLLAFLGSRASKSTAARIGLSALLWILGLILGFLGCLFLAFWFLTDHQVAYHNENILQCVPFTIAFVGIAIGMARNKRRSIERAYKLLRAAAVCSTLGLVMKVIPFFDQENGQIIALLWPMWLGAAAGLYLWTKQLGVIGVTVKPNPAPKKSDDEAAAEAPAAAS